MSTAIDGINDVDKRFNSFVETVVVLESHFDLSVVGFFTDVDGVVQNFFVPTHVGDQRLNTAFEVKLLGDTGGFIGKVEVEPGDEIGTVSNRVLDSFGVEFDGGEHSGVGFEVGESAGLDSYWRLASSRWLYGSCWHAPFVFLKINFAVPADFNPHKIREGVGDGCSYSVQTAGDLVNRFGEFTAGMEFSHG